MNHSKIIIDYIKAHPGADIQEITVNVEINRHIVELATTMMVEAGLITVVGLTAWDDPMFSVVRQK